MDGKELEDFGRSVREAIGQLTTWVNLTMDSFDSTLTMFIIAGLWRKSRKRSPRRVDEIYSPDLSMQRVIRK